MKIIKAFKVLDQFICSFFIHAYVSNQVFKANPNNTLYAALPGLAILNTTVYFGFNGEPLLTEIILQVIKFNEFSGIYCFVLFLAATISM